METSHPQALCKATSIPNRSQLKAGAKAQLRPAPLQAAQPQKAGGAMGHTSPLAPFPHFCFISSTPTRAGCMRTSLCPSSPPFCGTEKA